jgi:XTP/dITP diphosphohydrolase
MQPKMAELLLATNNMGKLAEYRDLLSGCGFSLVTPAEKGISIDVAETGSTFAENASIKAQTLATTSGMLTLADDSGLEVDALGGDPGVRSARYAGKKATDTERIALLLKNMEGISLERRTARFRCVIAIADPGGRLELADGSVEGVIAYTPRGNHGFGYDPVFLLPGKGLTMAELSPAEKNRISHRAVAAAEAWAILRYLASKKVLGP